MLTDLFGTFGYAQKPDNEVVRALLSKFLWRPNRSQIDPSMDAMLDCTKKKMPKCRGAGGRGGGKQDGADAAAAAADSAIQFSQCCR